MGRDQDLFTRFTQSLCHQGEAPLSEEQFQLLIGSRTEQWVSETLRGFDEGNPEQIESLKKWSQLARLTTGLGQLGLPIDMRGSMQLVREHGLARVMSLLSNARKNQDPAHRKEIIKMVHAILDTTERGGASNDAPSGSSQDRHPADRAEQQTPAQSRRLGQMPPPPGSMTQRAYSNSPDDDRRRFSESRDRPQSRRGPTGGSGTVAQFPTNGRRQTHDRDDGYGPSYDDHGQAYDSGRDSEQQEYDQAAAYNRGQNGCAVRFQNSLDKRKEPARPVVYVESAPIDPSSRSTYLWADKKITIMLNAFEAEQTLMVLYGMLDVARFTAHGADKKGWIQVAAQDPQSRYAGCVQVQMGRGQGTYTTNIFPTQLSPIRAVVLRAYMAMMRFDSMSDALHHLRLSAPSYAAYARANPPREEQGRRQASR